jgi:60 kDa SS-A/Ro ribonucleoprotein
MVLSLDVSGSMSGGTVAGVSGLTPCVAALALVTAATEPNNTAMGFSRGFVPISISPKQRLDDVVRMTRALPCE